MKKLHLSESRGPWGRALREGAVGGTVASLLSTAFMAWMGQRQDRRPAAPINAVSHWIWPGKAQRQDRPSLKYTATGMAIHQGAGLFWGVLHARAWGMRPQAKRPVPALVGGLAAAATACFVDYKLTPKRLQPGYEARLSTGAMVGLYAAFGLGLALSSLAFEAARDEPEYGWDEPEPEPAAEEGLRSSSLQHSTATGSDAGKVYSTAMSSSSS